jgi:hypothetical protein
VQVTRRRTDAPKNAGFRRHEGATSGATGTTAVVTLTAPTDPVRDRNWAFTSVNGFRSVRNGTVSIPSGVRLFGGIDLEYAERVGIVLLYGGCRAGGR